MTAIILDDELYCTEILYHMLRNHCPQVQHIDIYTDPAEALVAVKQNAPDVLFLDVDMPHMSGFDFLNALNSTTASVCGLLAEAN
jgi:two-component system, LytTR family, response regulator